MNSDFFFKDFFSKREHTLGIMLVYGSWKCIHVWRSFFLFRLLHFVNYKSVKRKPWLITKAECKNSSSTSTQVATVMKWKTDVPTL